MADRLVLFDGWALAYAPNAPGAVHTLTLLANQPPGWKAAVTLPGETRHPLPAEVFTLSLPTPNTGWGRFAWEQWRLPAAARRLGAQLIHFTDGAGAVFGQLPCVLSPADFTETEAFTWPAKTARPTPGGVRLRMAFGQGGSERVAAVLWPADLPAPQGALRWQTCPVSLHPAFTLPLELQPSPVQVPGVSLPGSYILYAGPQNVDDLQILFQAWKWAAGAIGETHPLVLVGLETVSRDALPGIAAQFGLGRSVLALPDLALAELVQVYRGCTALFHPACLSPWGDPLRLAMACSRPVVALETRLSDVLVGPGAYLVPAQAGRPDARALGAALITVVVETELAHQLAQAGWARAQAWQQRAFASRLAEIYAFAVAER